MLFFFVTVTRNQFHNTTTTQHTNMTTQQLLPHSKSQDLGNVVFLEHINLEITDLGAAIVFYIEGLGFTRDPYERTGPTTTWVNAGM